MADRGNETACFSMIPNWEFRSHEQSIGFFRIVFISLDSQNMQIELFLIHADSIAFLSKNSTFFILFDSTVFPFPLKQLLHMKDTGFLFKILYTKCSAVPMLFLKFPSGSTNLTIHGDVAARNRGLRSNPNSSSAHLQISSTISGISR
jgi:hypothetical protein